MRVKKRFEALKNAERVFDRIDIASSSIIIWEGYMAAQQPAYLFRSTVNVDAYAAPRTEK